jgi:hypothetical protein
MPSGNLHDTWKTLWGMIGEIPVVDAHTHVQDDMPGFDAETARQNVAGSQSSVNRPSNEVLAEGIRRGTLARRTMLDATHGLFYSWFAAVAEGAFGRLDEAVKAVGDNTDRERRRAGRFLLEQLSDSRYSEYAEWLRFMFRQYGEPRNGKDLLDPAGFDSVADAVAAQRHDPGFAAEVLRKHRIHAYVTSIENRANIPPRTPVHPGDVDLAYALHPESWSMFDCHPLIWPERATDAGLFLQGHKFQAERYLLHLEEYFEREISTVEQLQDAVGSFFLRVLRSPRSNPASRILYVNCFQAEGWRFSAPYSKATVDTAIRHHKEQLDGEMRRQVIACVAEAMLAALNDIGRQYKETGARFGCCLQMCGGATHFMDWTRQVQSIPAPIPRLAQDEYPVWARFPHVHFEYICAHEGLYSDLANAAKQVANVSVGPWWHMFRRRKIASMLADQISMGSLSSIACGFTDARFVEMIAAKYRSLRMGVVDAVAALVDDESSALHRDFDAAAALMRDLLFANPAAVHHIPVDTGTA